MHKHFDKYLNLKSFIDERKPKLIVECGAGNGDLTRKLSEFIESSKIDVISDNKIEGLDPRINFKVGLSYNELEKYENNSIDLCIIDTDHNYWTLMKELSAVMNKITEGGLIALHDVETFYHDTGMALSYWEDQIYPKEEIEKWAVHGSLGDAMIWFLNSFPFQFKLLAYNRESNGAALIEKRTQAIFSLLTPGPDAIFTKNKELQEVS